MLHVEGVRDSRRRRDERLGVLSLIFWLLVLVVAIKYLMFIMRADNHGEGGILALLALDPPAGAPRSRLEAPLRCSSSLGLFGAALLYGDGIITPAISVLSAVEGLKIATPAFEPYVVPISVVILIGCSSRCSARHGTRRRALRAGDDACGSSRSRVLGVA